MATAKQRGVRPRARGKSSASAFLIGALTAGLPLGSARAEPPPSGRVAADRLFEEGKASLESGAWVAACAKFQQSFEHDPSVSTSIKLARCRVYEGKPASAEREYRRALELNGRLPQSAERRRELEAVIRDELAGVEPRVPRLSVRIDPVARGLELSLDGRPIERGSLPGPLAVDPGRHVLVATAPGYRERRLELNVAEGTRHNLVLTLEQATQAPPASPVAERKPPPAHRTSATARLANANADANMDASAPSGGGAERTVGLVVGSAGVVALAVAAYFGVRTLSLVGDADCDANGECDDRGFRQMEKASDAQTTGFIIGGAGAAVLGIGAALYLTAPDTAERAPSERSVAARRPLGWGFEVGGAW